MTGGEVEVGDHVANNENPHKLVNNSFLPYIVNKIKLFEAISTEVSTSALVHNLCVAVVLQLQLMEQSDDDSQFLNDSAESYETICSLTSLICIEHCKGNHGRQLVPSIL